MGDQVHALHLMKTQMIVVLPRLRRFARVLTQSEADADDLLQEACLRALSKAEQWDTGQPLDKWLFRLTRNLWISELRKRKVRQGEGAVPAEEATELLSMETGEESAKARDLHQAIMSLPNELGVLLLLVSVEGYSYEEAAALFDIPKGTVMSRLHRARKLLRVSLNPTMEVACQNI